MNESKDRRWVGTWSTSPVLVEGIALRGQTVRMITRVSVGGPRLRVRISNAFGSSKLIVGAARVALPERGGRRCSGSDRRLTFNGSPSTAIPAGALAVSDPVGLDVAPLSGLAISVYVPGQVVEVTGHGNAHQTSYISDPGDHTEASTLPVQQTTEAFLLVSGVEVLAPSDTGGIVTLGDSLTDANISKLDANNRWPVSSPVGSRGGAAGCWA